MPLLAYTTQIAADKTLGEIQRMLAKAGARSILVEYDDRGEPSALAFLLKTPRGDEGYKLPANLDATFRVLTRQNGTGAVQRRFVTREQAARVSWRILREWVAAQLAIVETEMVSLDEVMYAYGTVETGVTRFQAERALLALPPGNRAGGVER